MISVGGLGAAFRASPADRWAQDWLCIACVAALAIAGECLIAGAMRRLGDLDELRTGSGLRSYFGPIRAVLSSPMFLAGALCMALNFFAMLFTLSLVDLSLAAPAIGSLTYVGNAIAAKLFLRENVDRRRWLATSFLAVGVILVSR
jgi:drug/metabolite transporter (DMT)-like permease